MTGSRSLARGFTLIELLVVAAIISLLAALLIPSANRARQQAARLGCANNLRIFSTALNYYRTELGRYPLPGDRNPSSKPHKQSCRYPQLCTANPCEDRWNLVHLKDLTVALVAISLEVPAPMFCPVSLHQDPRATRPVRITPSGFQEPVWKLIGEVSYIYLAGIRMPFADADGRATYRPELESPDRAVNRANVRAVLAGDRTVERAANARGVPDSNHGRSGGFFAYTTGEVLWHDWATLTPHPAIKTYTWFWPGLGKRPGS